MSKELIINASLPEIRIALMEEGKIQELLVEKGTDRGVVGNIYKGRVTRVLPGMQAAFVDIGLEKAAFLYVDDVVLHSKVKEEIEEAVAEDDGEEESLEASSEEAGDLDEIPEEEMIAEEAGASDEELGEEESDESEESLEEDGRPEDMGPPPSDDDSEGEEKPEGTVAPSEAEGSSPIETASAEPTDASALPDSIVDQLTDDGGLESDRVDLNVAEGAGQSPQTEETMKDRSRSRFRRGGKRKEFRQRRRRDRRVRTTRTSQLRKANANIEDLLKEGQEVIVQVAKEPIANKGARLTCHVSLPGRHLVCMPTIDHVGVSRRIDSEGDRRRLREVVDKNRPKGMGFIVRTASGTENSEEWILQDIEYLADLWKGIRAEADQVSAPAMIYEDLDAIMRSIRDWTTEDISKILVDSRFYFNEIKGFADRLMPSITDRIELYHGDVPIFDAYGISTEMHRALERRVWLKSGGYIVVDQAEALVAIDVNTGRYVGKKNLEDTILKTNLEAVEEIANQLRLRNCGGIIIIDLIDMEKEENRHRVVRALEAAIAKDRARPTIVRMTDLGLIEMTRKRTRDTMVRALCQTCNHCEGKGFVKAKDTVAYDVLREIERAGVDREIKKILVQAHPDVIDILGIDERDTLATLEKRYQKEIYLQSVMDFHLEQFEVSGDEPQRRRDRYQRSRSGNRSNARRSSGGNNRQRRRRPQRSRNDSKTKTESSPKNESSPSTDQSTPNHPEDADAIGNRAASGESAPPAEANGNAVTPQAGNTSTPYDGDDDFSEEDRLAYLRAQAAQDAALAGNAESGNASPSQSNRSRSSRGASGNGRGGSRGGRGGGKSGGRGGRGGSGGGRGRRGGRGRSSSRSGNEGGSGGRGHSNPPSSA